MYSNTSHSTLHRKIEQYLEKYIGIWNNTSAKKCTFKAPICYSNQKKNFDNAMGMIDRYKYESDEKYPLEDGFLSAKWSMVFLSTLNCPKNESQTVLNKAFESATRKFVHQAKTFDPKLRDAEIYQALRNFWIANSLQSLFNQKVAFTPSFFAYSLLYPYTDNLIDDPTITDIAKKQFNQKIYDHLLGKNVGAANDIEAKVFDLINMIKEEYPSAHYFEPIAGLLAIHDAQCQSVRLQTKFAEISESEIMRISFYKGATSVLADGYLLHGTLNEDQFDFCFGYGIFLQLLDDLKDLKDDITYHQASIFSRSKSPQCIMQKIFRLFNYCHQFFAIARLRFGNHLDLLNFIDKSCQLLIFKGMAENSEYLQSNLIRHIEQYSPLLFADFNLLEKQISKTMRETKLVNH